MTSGKSDSILGAPLARVDGPKKVTGHAKYAADYLPSGVKFGWLIQSTIGKGKIADIDDSAARKVPGVLDVITHKNALNLDVSKSSPFDHSLLLLQNDDVLHDRQNIGIVVADSLETANYAASLVKVRYNVEKPQVDINSPQVKATEYAPPDNPGQHLKTDSKRGDFESAFAGAPIKIDHDYETPREVHVPMEPHATTAMWTGDKLTVWDSTQGISNVQKRMARLFRLEPANVRVICKFTGGGFGSKGAPWSHVGLAAMAAKMTGAPVCLAMNRPQTFGPVGFRPNTIQHIQLAADESGKLLAMRNQVRLETCEFDEFVEYAGLPTRYLYSCPNVETSHRLLRMNIGTPTYQRAPGFSTGTYGLEAAMDELANACKIDPLQLRLINYSDEDGDKGRPYSHKKLRECYEIGAEQFGWSKRNPEPASMRDGKHLVGMGLATATYPAHFFPAKAKATINADGSAFVVSGSQDIGTGTYTAMTQVAAQSLGLPVARVDFDLGDTDYPPAGVSGGSTTACSVGSAIKAACDQVIKKLADLAVADAKSPLSGANPETLSVSEGSLVDSSGRADRFADIVTRSGQPSVSAEGKSNAGEEQNRYSMFSHGAQFAEVRVDPLLGSIRVSRWVAVFDGGKIFNHKTAMNQMYGGITMGIGMAMLEASIMDQRYGRTMNASLAEYHVPVNLDVPDLQVSFIDAPDFHANPLGGHGVGELPITGAAAAVANAVFHATGVRVRQLPITLDKVLADISERLAKA